jgi:hypothetical protein
MDFGTLAIPAGASVTTLGALLGPVSLVGVAATLVTLGVVIAGLVFERRDSATLRRITRSPRPAAAATETSTRRAA